VNKLLKIISPPKSNYTDYNDLAKYEVTWNLMVFLAIGMIPTTAVYFFFDFRAFFPSLYALTVCTIQLVWFAKKKNYKINGFIYMLHAVLFLGVEMIFKEDTIHLIEFPWFVVFSMYGFLVLGKKQGLLLITISLFFIFIYVIFYFEDNVSIVLKYLTPLHLIAVFFNLVMAMTFMSFVLLRFKQTSSYANKKYKEVNEDLKSKSALVFAQNEEKTIMLKEIHHRVKNNLQVISSLIRLQSFETDNEEAKEMFDATVNRVVAMALIHEKMYQNDNLAKINLEEYLDSLSQDIIRSYNFDKTVEFKIKSEIDIIGNRTIVPLALIFNELISNSLKHAFKSVVKGKIEITITKFDASFFLIKYSDNGVWIKDMKGTSFGLELISTFSEQLDGTVSRNSNEKGTVYSFKLKNIE